MLGAAFPLHDGEAAGSCALEGAQFATCHIQGSSPLLDTLELRGAEVRDGRHTRPVSCPRCGGNAYKIISPGYFECTSAILVPGPVATPQGTAIMPVPALTCGLRYQAGSAGDARTCSCGTYAVGLCKDCIDPVCGDHSLMTGNQRLCTACAEARQARQADKERGRERTAVKAALEAIRERPDPVERLVRIAWFLDNCEAPEDAWNLACPEYPRGQWDSAAVGRWFATAAGRLGFRPTRMLPTYIPRPAARLFLLLGMPGYDPGPDIPCWSFEEGSTESRLVTPNVTKRHVQRAYQVTEPACVLYDGRVVTYHSPGGKPRYGPRPRIDTAGREELRAAGLNQHALVQMAVLLGMTDQLPGLKKKYKPINYTRRH